VVFKLSGLTPQEPSRRRTSDRKPGRLVLPTCISTRDEYSYVLEGTIGARVGDARWLPPDRAATLLKPRGLMHTFWNPAPASAAPGDNFPGRIRDVLRRACGGRRFRATFGVGGEVRADLLIGLGR